MYSIEWFHGCHADEYDMAMEMAMFCLHEFGGLVGFIRLPELVGTGFGWNPTKIQTHPQMHAGA